MEESPPVLSFRVKVVDMSINLPDFFKRKKYWNQLDSMMLGMVSVLLTLNIKNYTIASFIRQKLQQ